MKAAPESSRNRPVNLSKNPASDQDPTWSPDGKKIAFVTDRDGNSEIYRMRATDGAQQTNLTKNPALDFQPAWPPRPSQRPTCVNGGGHPGAPPHSTAKIPLPPSRENDTMSSGAGTGHETGDRRR